MKEGLDLVHLCVVYNTSLAVGREGRKEGR